MNAATPSHERALSPRFTSRRFAALALVGAASLALAACSTGSDPALEESVSAQVTQAAIEVEPQGSSSASASAAPEDNQDATAEGGPVTADGMPEVPLLGCETLLNYTVNETDFDTQWTWEFECRSAEPFFKTVEAMNAASGWTHTVDAPGGNPDYLTDKHHYIADLGGVAFDVDLSAMGEPSELEVTYIVTLAKP